MRDGGVYRYRRYGRFGLDAGTRELIRIAHHDYFQEADVNPLNGGFIRRFARSPTGSPTIRCWSRAAEGVRRWYVEPRPVRIVIGNGQLGKPAPRGLHRTGSRSSRRWWCAARNGLTELSAQG